jgi:hypothetical protein
LDRGDHHHVVPCSRFQHLEEPQHLVRGAAIEVAGGLIADQEHRIGDDGAGDGHALLLPPDSFRGL